MPRSTFTCGLDAVLAISGGKWKPLIIYHLAHGTHRYGELRRAVGNVTDKMLIQHLKEMLADGLIARHDFKDIPPKVEYALTPLGKSLAQALAPLCVWGTEHMSVIEKVVTDRSLVATQNGS